MKASIQATSCLMLVALFLPIAGEAALVPAESQPSTVTTTLLARGGGAGGRGRGGNRGGGAGSRGSVQRSQGRTGFQGASSGLNRGDRTPTGGWSNRVPSSAARPAISRPAAGSREISRDGGSRPTRGGNNDRDLNRDLNNRDLSRDINRNGDRDIRRDGNRNIDRDVSRNWNRQVNINNVTVNPGWARPGWGVARPWNHGWYGGWSNPPWGWWGAQAAVWGIGALATASVINNAVDAAIDNQVTYIVVPSTSYQLLYGSVNPVGSQSVAFAVTADGSTYQLTADCQAGTIDGRTPSSPSEAQLLNAACQVAFGNA